MTPTRVVGPFPDSEDLASSMKPLSASNSNGAISVILPAEDSEHHVNNGFNCYEHVNSNGDYSGTRVVTANNQAIKLAALTDSSNVETLKREGQLLESITHDNIVRFLDWQGSSSDVSTSSGFSMELASCSVHDVIFPVQYSSCSEYNHYELCMYTARLALHWAFQAVSALSHLHDRGVQHGDVKPANMLLFEPNYSRLKLCDFELASQCHASNSVNSEIEDSRSIESSSDSLVVSPTYAPPEVLNGSKYDTHSDIYSFGISLYEMFSRSPAFCDIDDDNVLYFSIVAKQRPSRTENIPGFIEELYLSSWAHEICERPTVYNLLTNIQIARDSFPCENDHAQLSFHDVSLPINNGQVTGLLNGAISLSGLSSYIFAKDATSLPPKLTKLQSRNCDCSNVLQKSRKFSRVDLVNNNSE